MPIALKKIFQRVFSSPFDSGEFFFFLSYKYQLPFQQLMLIFWRRLMVFISLCSGLSSISSVVDGGRGVLLTREKCFYSFSEGFFCLFILSKGYRCAISFSRFIHILFQSKRFFFFFFIFNDVYNDNYLFDAWVLNPMRLVYILFQSFFLIYFDDC